MTLKTTNLIQNNFTMLAKIMITIGTPEDYIDELGGFSDESAICIRPRGSSKSGIKEFDVTQVTRNQQNGGNATYNKGMR